MIALLRGVVAGATAGEVVLDVGGVGYRVRVPAGTVIAARGQEQQLHTHLAVREDALDLYGFATTAARDLFEVLLTVTGVGPKLALAALGTLGADGLRAAVIGEDVTALTVIPGVGRKGAQRMILELQSKLGSFTDDLPSASPATAGDARGEVRQALAALGYGAAEIQTALASLPADGQPEELIRAALRGLARIA